MPIFQACPQLSAPGGVLLHSDFLDLRSAPEPPDPPFVRPTALAIYADGLAQLGPWCRPFLRGGLADLIAEKIFGFGPLRGGEFSSMRRHSSVFLLLNAVGPNTLNLGTVHRVTLISLTHRHRPV